MVIENSYGLLTMMMDYLIIFFLLPDSSKQQSKFFTGKGYTFKSQMAPIHLPVEFLFTQQTYDHTILSIAGLRHRKCIPFNTFYTVSLLFASSLLFNLFLFEVQFSSTKSHTVAIEFTFNIQFWWQIQSTFVVSFFYEIIVWKDTIIVGKKKKSTREKMKTKE